MVTEEEIVWLYRALLGRDPESRQVVKDHQQTHASFASFRSALLRSGEFRSIVSTENIVSKQSSPQITPTLPLCMPPEVFETTMAHVLVVHSVDHSRLLASVPRLPFADLWIIYFHGDDCSLARVLSNFASKNRSILCNLQENRGLARSWNDSIVVARENGCDHCMLLNDDLFFTEGAYSKFRRRSEEIIRTNDKVGLITPMGLESGSSPHAGEVRLQMFACSVLCRSSIEKIGFFDENFRPAYFEDSDYSTRMKIAGLGQAIINETLVEHRRSSTLNTNEKLRQTHSDEFTANREYFGRKWGDYQNPSSFYDHPFNDKELGLKIDADARSNPYPRHGRVKPWHHSPTT